MTPQQTIESEPTSSAAPQSFADWLQVNTRYVGIAAGVLAVAAIGYWYYLRSAELKRINAERGLTQAKQSMAAGNPALAMADLQKVVTRYKGTPAGSEAAMVLAQVHYDQGKPDEGLNALESYASRGGSGENFGAVMSLVGDGRLLSGKPDDAASAYKQAADATSRPGERALYRAKQARALMVADKDAEARTIWRELIDDPEAVAVKSEATVRLGELEVRPAGRS
jgi:hypothetical protein